MEFCAGAETVTVTVPVDDRNALAPPYHAVIVLAPAVSWLPLTVMLAVAPPEEPERLALPSWVWPRLKYTGPPGAAEPVAAFTVAVRTVDAFAAKAVGLAVTVVV